MAEEMPIMDELPEVEIEGNKYYLGRLTLAHIFKILKVFARAGSIISKNLDNLDFTNKQTLGLLLMTSVPFAEREILELIASVVKVKSKDKDGKEVLRYITVDELLDPDLFPMFSIVPIVQTLIKHQDMKVFFDNLVGLMNNPEILASLGLSTTSKKDTGGKTKKS